MSKKTHLVRSTPSQRERERLISKALRAQSVEDFKDESEYIFKVNHFILKKILKMCPLKHLVFLTYSGLLLDSDFEENKSNLLAKVQPDDKSCTDCNSSMMCFNPKNCSDIAWVIDEFTSKLNPHSNTIMFWEFIPYPEHWN